MEGQLEFFRGDLALEAARPGGRGRPLTRPRRRSRDARGSAAETSCYALRAVRCSRRAMRRVRSPPRPRRSRCIAPSISLRRTPRRRRRSGGGTSEALTANGQPRRARKALERSYGFLLDGIANLRDEGLRRSYLNKVAANRRILAAWVADATARKLPRERALAHLVDRIERPRAVQAARGHGAAAQHAAQRCRYPPVHRRGSDGAFRRRARAARAATREAARARGCARAARRGCDAGCCAPSSPISREPRRRAPRLAHTPAAAAAVKQRSRIVAPLDAQGQAARLPVRRHGRRSTAASTTPTAT